MMGVAGAEQRLKTIHAYQGMIRFMLDEEGLNGKGNPGHNSRRVSGRLL